MKPYQRIFGAGPLGALISVLALAASAWLASRFEGLQITASDGLRFAAFTLLSVITLLIILWSVKSLPPADRGRTLVTGGAFRYFRHPNYFLNIIPELIGLALVMKSYIVLLMLFPVYLISLAVRIIQEEKLMRSMFSDY